MSTHEGDEPVEGERPAEETALADAVDDAMKREVWRALAPQFERLTYYHERVEAPRERDDIQDILDKIRDEERNQDPDDDGSA